MQVYPTILNELLCSISLCYNKLVVKHDDTEWHSRHFANVPIVYVMLCRIHRITYCWTSNRSSTYSVILVCSSVEITLFQFFALPPEAMLGSSGLIQLMLCYCY